MPEFLTAVASKFSRMAEFGLLASYGASANYVYTMLKNEDQKFSLFKFLALLFLAAFLGNVLGGFIPANSDYRDELLMGIGFCTFPLLAVLEEKVRALMIRYLDKKLG